MLPIRHAGHPPYGRFNSLCHRLSLITFDDQNPNLAGYTGQVTLKGYDNMTGIGTPRGQSFISALRRLAG